jgi:hypothetical protein
LSTIGLAFLLFLAGLEIDVRHFRGPRARLAALGLGLSVVLALGISGMLHATGVVESTLLVAIIFIATPLGMIAQLAEAYRPVFAGSAPRRTSGSGPLTPRPTKSSERSRQQTKPSPRPRRCRTGPRSTTRKVAAMTTEIPPRRPDLAAMAAYEAWCISVADRQRAIPPRWDQIPQEDRAGWRAVADGVTLVASLDPLLHGAAQLVAKLRELHRPFGIYDECDCKWDDELGAAQEWPALRLPVRPETDRLHRRRVCALRVRRRHCSGTRGSSLAHRAECYASPGSASA